jgi:hypothetical protein
VTWVYEPAPDRLSDRPELASAWSPTYAKPTKESSLTSLPASASVGPWIAQRWISPTTIGRNMGSADVCGSQSDGIARRMYRDRIPPQRANTAIRGGTRMTYRREEPVSRASVKSATTAASTTRSDTDSRYASEDGTRPTIALRGSSASRFTNPARSVIA